MQCMVYFEWLPDNSFPMRNSQCPKQPLSNAIQLFPERLSEKMCTPRSRKVIWDMVNTLFLTNVAVEPTFVAFLKHSKTYVRGLPCHSFRFLRRTECTQNHAQYLSGLSRALFPTTFLEIAVCKCAYSFTFLSIKPTKGFLQIMLNGIRGKIPLHVRRN